MVRGAGLVEYFIRNTCLLFFEPGFEPDHIFGRVPIDAPLAYWHTAAAYSLGRPSVAQDVGFAAVWRHRQLIHTMMQ
eukprot:7370797-Alexandrium_andersonii.AAC.1